MRLRRDDRVEPGRAVVVGDRDADLLGELVPRPTGAAERGEVRVIGARAVREGERAAHELRSEHDDRVAVRDE